MRALAWVLITFTKLVFDAHYFDGYDPAAPLNAQILSEEEREGYRRVYFAFEGVGGMRVPSLMALPLEGAGPFPTLVFLHGIGQEKEFLDQVAGHYAAEGLVLATFDQYMQGERRLRGANWRRKARAMYARGALTVNEARRLVDYLETRPDVAKDRIYLIGASYGAMTGAIAGAFDKRFKAVNLVYGGGDFTKMARSREVPKNLRRMAGPVARLIAWFAAVSDPVRYVHAIAPRPLLCQNGEKDRIVVPGAAQALYDAAREPKEIVWYPSDHLDLDPEYIPIAIKDGIAWFKAQDAKLAGTVQ